MASPKMAPLASQGQSNTSAQAQRKKPSIGYFKLPLDPPHVLLKQYLQARRDHAMRTRVRTFPHRSLAGGTQSLPGRGTRWDWVRTPRDHREWLSAGTAKAIHMANIPAYHA